MVPSDAEWADRRESQRHSITLRVDYKRVNTFFADYAKNISKGGTFIHTDRPLDTGTEFVFVLTVPGHAPAIELRGQVVWTITLADATEEHPAGMGIRFRFDRDQERRSLHGLVENLMAEKLGPHVASKLLSKI
jgi:type IV pilus assembly protein PilZ